MIVLYYYVCKKRSVFILVVNKFCLEDWKGFLIVNCLELNFRSEINSINFNKRVEFVNGNLFILVF